MGMDQTLGHYHGVGLKLGVDLLKRQKNGSFIFHDLLKEVSSQYTDSTAQKKPTHHTKSVGWLCETIRQKSLEFADTSKSITLIFDKLTLLTSLGVSVPEILAFIQWMQMFASDREATLITLCRGHSSRELNSRYKDDMELDSCNDVIVAFLDHTSHLTVVVWPLTTGYSQVV